MIYRILHWVAASAALLAAGPLPAGAAPYSYSYTPQLVTSDMEAGCLFFLCPAEDSDTEDLRAALPQAHFLLKRGGVEVEQRPAALRPATVGDALAHWDDFCQALQLVEGSVERRESLERRAPGEELAQLWVVDVPLLQGPGDRWELHLPGMGDRGVRNVSCKDLIAGSAEMPPYSLSLENETLAKGRFCVTLHATQPMEAAALEQALAGQPLMIAAPDRRQTYALVRQEDGSWTGEVPALHAPQATVAQRRVASLRLRLDREATEQAAREVELADGRRVKGYERAVFTAETSSEGSPPVLVSTLCPPSVYGQKPLSGGSAASRTRLIESSPFIFCSLRATALSESGRRQVTYLCRQMQAMHARVYRLDNRGTQTARVLRGYREGYLPIDRAHTGDPVEPEPRLMPTDKLGGDMRECRLPLPEPGRRGHFDPTSLYPDSPARGLYVVELIATPQDGFEEGRCCVTQSVVQVTDLGLYWRQGRHGLLACAYHLSDGSRVEQGQLLLLGTEGQELARYELKDGIARGKVPVGSCYLQVLTLDDAYTTELNKGGRPQRAPGAATVQNTVRASFFTDRNVYREGDTLHLGGFVREGRPGSYCLPEDVFVRLNYSYRDDKGRFTPCTLSLPMDERGVVNAAIPLDNCTHLGDMRVEVWRRGSGKCLSTQYLFPKLITQLRPSAQLDGGCAMQGQDVRAWLAVTQADGRPLTGADVTWNFDWFPVRFSPAGFEDYHFGDGRLRPESLTRLPQLPRYFRTARNKLDDSGFADVNITLRREPFPTRLRVALHAEINQGGGLQLHHRETMVVDPASLYVGLRRSSRSSKVGDTLPLDLVLVQADGRPYEGAPVPVTLRVEHEDFPTTLYGFAYRHGQRELGETTRELQVPAEGGSTSVSLPAEGCYHIIVSGQDAEGRAFATVINQNVWSGEGFAPWLPHERDISGLGLEADKASYRTGERARVLVKGVVEGEALVTVESRHGLRCWHCPVTASQNWVEIPILPEDGCEPNVEVTLVQGRGARPASGLPLVQHGSVKLQVAQDVPSLRIEMEPQPQGLRPGEVAEIVGRVLDPGGRPVPHADLLLYAVDQGVNDHSRSYRSCADMSVQELKPGELSRTFVGAAPVIDKPQVVRAFADKGGTSVSRRGQGSYTGDVFEDWEFGNKGVFVGGHSSDEAGFALGPEGPCVLWARLVTDEAGCFRCRFVTPGSHTHYRLVAVAAAGTELFGESHAAISVEP